MTRALLLFLGLAGCSKILGIDDLHGPGSGSADAQSGDGARMDAALPDVPVAPTIKVTGQITIIDPTTLTRSPVPNMPVELHRTPGDVIAGSGATDGNGNFTLTVQTAGMLLTGYVYAMGKTINAQDAYYYLRPLSVDTTLTNFVLFTQQGINLLAQFSSVPAPSPQNAFVFAFVTGPDNVGRAGVVVQAVPNTGAVRYFNAAASQPDTSLMATSASGVAVIFDVPPQPTHVTGTQPGLPTAMYDLPAKPMTTAYIPLVMQ